MKIKMVIILFVFSTILSVKIYSQSDNHFHRVTTFKMMIPDNGSVEELNYLLDQWIEKIGKRNHHILDYHVEGYSNSRNGFELIVTDEYDNREFLEIGNKSNIKLRTNSFPESKNEFLKLNKYIKSRTEEIHPIEDFYIK